MFLKSDQNNLGHKYQYCFINLLWKWLKNSGWISQSWHHLLDILLGDKKSWLRGCFRNPGQATPGTIRRRFLGQSRGLRLGPLRPCHGLRVDGVHGARRAHDGADRALDQLAKEVCGRLGIDGWHDNRDRGSCFVVGEVKLMAKFSEY